MPRLRLTPVQQYRLGFITGELIKICREIEDANSNQKGDIYIGKMHLTQAIDNIVATSNLAATKVPEKTEKAEA